MSCDIGEATEGLENLAHAKVRVGYGKQPEATEPI